MYQVLYSSENGKIYSRGERRGERHEWRKKREEKKGGCASPILSLPYLALATSRIFKGGVTRDDSRRRFLAQHSVAMLEQCCSHLKQCRDNVTTLCCAKSRRCESSRVTSP